MTYPDYLIHFNKNHSKSNGQFVSGDGDGDGVVNDHANQKKEHKPLSKKARVAIGVSAAVIGTGAMVAGAIGLGKELAWQNRQRKFNAELKNALTRVGEQTVNLYKNIPVSPLLSQSGY